MPLVSDKTPRWRNWVGLGLLLLTIVLLVWVLEQGSGVKAAVTATRDSIERTDCARRVNADQVRVRDEATLADRAVSRYYFKVLFNRTYSGVPGTTQQVIDFGQLLTAADAADKRVDDLPDPAAVVDHLCPG